MKDYVVGGQAGDGHSFLFTCLGIQFGEYGDYVNDYNDYNSHWGLFQYKAKNTNVRLYMLGNVQNKKDFPNATSVSVKVTSFEDWILCMSNHFFKNWWLDKDGGKEYINNMYGNYYRTVLLTEPPCKSIYEIDHHVVKQIQLYYGKKQYDILLRDNVSFDKEINFKDFMQNKEITLSFIEDVTGIERTQTLIDNVTNYQNKQIELMEKYPILYNLNLWESNL